MKERWYDVPGYEEIYRVSTRGRVRSLPRKDARGNRRRGRILRSSMGTGCRRYYLLCRNGSVKMYCVSALLTLAYGIPNPRRCGYVIHVDGDYDNFRRSNLRWATLAEQRLHDGLKHDTPYYGVSLDKRKPDSPHPWVVQLRHLKRPRLWRQYSTPEEAAYAYDQAVRRLGLKRPINNIRRPAPRRPPEIESLPGEIWRPFPGTRGTHVISSKGRVRRLNHVSSSGRRLIPKLRKISVNARGFSSVLIRGRRYGIKTVMARVFRGSPQTRQS